MSLFSWVSSLFKKPTVITKVIPIKTPMPMVDPNLSYSNLYAVARIRSEHQAELNDLALKIQQNKSRYDAVSIATGMPWYLIAAIHSLEAGLRFNTYLQNGDPLFNSDGKPVKTVHVPKGVGPFSDWQSAAIAALQPVEQGPWNIGHCLAFAERYNGMGYKKRGVVDPYLFSYTDLYEHGKYTSDGVFDANAVDKQPGVAAIFKALNIPNV